ncbi:MAG: putative periplasmic/secreted protein [Myxococcales bacterium]|nr:putative periplasmic/secreted protein [Myxococcales bacterium]
MRKRRGKGVVSLLAEGLFVGLAATRALDWLSTILYEREDALERAEEDRARGGLTAYERAVEQMTTRLGKRLDTRQLGRWGWRFHESFGVAAGIGYVALRRRYPRVGASWGLAFGAAFFLVADELMMPLFGWTPGPRAFSWKVHARGAVSHLAYGVAAEAAARAFERGREALAGTLDARH